MRKKTFKCGHKGLGEFCHRCLQAKEHLELSGNKKKLEELAKERNTKPEILAEYFKLSAEKLKAVPGKV